MHSYATDAKDKEIVPEVLAVLAIGTALLLTSGLQALKIQIPWWLDVPSVMGFYGLFHTLYDTVLWHLSFGCVGFSGIPDIRGTWIGVIKSSFEPENEVKAVLHIRQTWSKLLVRVETADSTSCSTMAALNTEDAAQPGLRYEYQNEPGVFGVETMQSHRGTACLQLNPSGAVLVGDYYTGRGRQTIGALKVQLVSRTYLGYEAAMLKFQISESAVPTTSNQVDKQA